LVLATSKQFHVEKLQTPGPLTLDPTYSLSALKTSRREYSVHLESCLFRVVSVVRG